MSTITETARSHRRRRSSEPASRRSPRATSPRSPTMFHADATWNHRNDDRLGGIKNGIDEIVGVPRRVDGADRRHPAPRPADASCRRRWPRGRADLDQRRPARTAAPSTTPRSSLPLERRDASARSTSSSVTRPRSRRSGPDGLRGAKGRRSVDRRLVRRTRLARRGAGSMQSRRHAVELGSQVRALLTEHVGTPHSRGFARKNLTSSMSPVGHLAPDRRRTDALLRLLGHRPRIPYQSGQVPPVRS